MYVYDSKPAPEEAFLRRYGVEGDITTNQELREFIKEGLESWGKS